MFQSEVSADQLRTPDADDRQAFSAVGLGDMIGDPNPVVGGWGPPQPEFQSDSKHPQANGAEAGSLKAKQFSKPLQRPFNHPQTGAGLDRVDCVFDAGQRELVSGNYGQIEKADVGAAVSVPTMSCVLFLLASCSSSSASFCFVC
jgi:hypothetical protein